MSELAGQQILITLEQSGDHSVHCKIPENTDGTKYKILVLQNTNNRSKVGVGEEAAKTIRHLGNSSSLLLLLQPILHKSTFLVLDLEKPKRMSRKRRRRWRRRRRVTPRLVRIHAD